jgi:hypothetical protein
MMSADLGCGELFWNPSHYGRNGLLSDVANPSYNRILHGITCRSVALYDLAAHREISTLLLEKIKLVI